MARQATGPHLTVYGPIPIETDARPTNTKHIKIKRIGKRHADAFWSDQGAAAIAEKQGCYIFALRASRGYKVWYVGKATKSFRQECFTSHKLGHYNEVLFEGRKGTPVLFFIAGKGNVRSVSGKACSEIEKFLIQTACIKNPEIKNKHMTKRPRWTVAGIIGHSTGNISREARSVRTMLGLD